MPQVKLHQDVEGKRAGDVVTVEKDRADFLVLNGYASKKSDKSDKALVTTVGADADPTQAENREAPEEFDAAKAEDEASNGEVAKRAAVEESLTPTRRATTQKRDRKAPAATEEPSEG